MKLVRSLTGQDLVALVLASAVGISTILFAASLLFEVIDHASISEVPSNSSQVLTAVYGGIIGILGSYLGYRQGSRSAKVETPDENPEQEVGASST